MTTEIELSKKAALVAGELLLKEFSRLKNVNSDVGRDIKLELDEKSEQLIKSIIQSNSGHPILAEESDNSHITQEGKYWVIDPLDGTYNYFRGFPSCAVSIALWDKDRPLIGTIYDFINKDLMWGGKGLGVYLNKERIEKVKINSLDQAVLATGFPVSLTLDQRALDRFFNITSSFKKVRMIGSAAKSLYGVAAGHFDVYWEDSIMLWDIAAGLAFVEELGGGFSLSKTKKEYCYDAIASCNIDFIKKLEDVIKSGL
jgi:myo-inositol-1(or 4)-monophosphatase